MAGTTPKPVRVDHGRNLRLDALVAAMVAAGGVSLVVAVAKVASAAERPAIWRILLSVAVLAISEVAVLHLRFGTEKYTLTWSEGAILVGLILTPGPWISIAGVAGVGITQLVGQRDPRKIAFNVGSIAAVSTLCALSLRIFDASDPARSLGTPHGYAALTTAACVFFVCNSVLVSAAVALASGRAFGAVMREGLLLKIGMMAGNTVIALLLVSVPWQGSVAILVPFCLVLLFLTYRAYFRALEDSGVWQQLDAAAKELTLLDRSHVAEAAAARAVSLFNAEFAEVLLERNGVGDELTFRHSNSGAQSDADAAAPGGEPPSIVEEPLMVAVDSDASVIGALRLGLRPATRLSRRQRLVLRTFAHSVATSVQNASLYAEMRHQAKVNAYEATRDPLTGVANRRVLHAELAAAVDEVAQSELTAALLLIDLDHFKDINDTLGHHTGDAVLCVIATRLARAVSSADVVARLGGDEFAVVVRGLREPSEAETVANRLLTVLAEVVEYEGLHLAVGGSIGIACYPQDGDNPEDLLRLADTALYQAKEQRGAIARYRSDRDAHSLGRITLAADLRDAISAQQFILHYQAQVDLLTGHVVGAEALARWRHPSLGLLGPDRFIDLVDRSSVVHEFALAILDAAITEAALWQRRGAHIPVSVNLSARNLLDPRLPGDVAEILIRHGLPPERLILEITETTMITDAPAVEAVLARLRRVGVQLSVDDFGTGYSSLAFLQRVAVNEIKIDRTFVSAMTTSESDAAIVRATIELAHGLGVRVVAEGVETLDHVIALRDLGCDVAQGWHYGRPAPGPHLRSAWLGLDEPRRATRQPV
jgi:diguanylate cyclase (GGDEF)-like protein